MDDKGGDQISGSISGNVSGQAAIGKNIQQTQVGGGAEPPTAEELAELKRSFEALRELVGTEAPAEEREAALERVDELEQAVQAEEPDVSTMEYVRNWFAKRLPGIAGAVTGVVVNPIVGKLVAAAGDAVAGEFKRRFGGEQPPA